MDVRKYLRWIPLVLLLVAVGLGLWHAYDLLQEDAFPFDDAYISFRYADNLVRGRGLVYNPGEPVEGYTNFLWVLLVAVGIRLGFDPLVTAQVLGGASLLVSIALLARVIWLAQQGVTNLLGRTMGVGAAVMTCYWLVDTDGVVAFAGCGLETLLVGALALTVGLVSHLEHDRWRGWKWGWVHSLAPAALVLTRMDAAVFVGVSGLVFLGRSVWQRRGRLSWVALVDVLRAGIQRYALLGALIGSWLLWKWRFYGGILPNTYYAKGANEPMWEAGKAYIWTFLQSYPASVGLAALCIAGIGLGTRRHTQDFALWASASLGLFTYYVWRVGGDFMHYRFAFEVYAVLLGGAALALVLLARYRGLPSVALAAAITLAIPGEVIMETDFSMQSLGAMKKFVYDGSRSGPRLNESLPPDTIISATLAGTIAYYSDLTTIDELGLNDAFVAHQKGHAPVRGHGKRAPLDYLRKRQVNLVVSHPWDVHCTPAARTRTRSQHRPHSPLVWLHIDKGDCVRLQYLTQTPELTKWLCEHPEDFIVEDIECPH